MTMTRHQQFSVWAAAVALLCVLGLPAPAAANDKPVQGLWLASHATEPMGRLEVKNGMLTFHGARSEWSTPLADITRVTPVKGSADTFEIRTVDGDMLQLRVFTPKLVPESRKKAIQLIQRAVRETPATPRPVLAAAAPAGSVR